MDFPEGERPDEQPDWDPQYGDRKQMLVFIGQNMDEASIRASLDACLLDEALANQGVDAWEALESPFPTLEMAPEEPEEAVA